MGQKKGSPSRRKSIAVPYQDKPAFISRSKRRAHSIVPGDRLSPLARARRSLVPRKSILKGSVNNSNGSQPNSQSPTPQSQLLNPDDPNGTHASINTTADLDNTTRRRRVSFAPRAFIRTFKKMSKDDDTSSTGTPQSPYDPDNAPHIQEVPPAPRFHDENDYPGSHRRRSSVRYSIAPSEGEDMDLTSIGPFDFSANQAGDESALLDEEFGYGQSLDDMEVTAAVNGSLLHRRSLTSSHHPLHDANVSQTSDSYPSDTDHSRDQEMEFTVPLGQSLRPAHEDEAWLALRQMTQSGTDSADEADAEVPDQFASFNHNYNAEDSYNDEDVPHNIENGDDTINISRVLGWPSSLEEDVQRLSLGNQDSSMDESEVYGSLAPVVVQTAPRLSTTPHPSIVPSELQPSIVDPEEAAIADVRAEQEEEVSRTPTGPAVFRPPQSNELASSSRVPDVGIVQGFSLQNPRPFTFTAPQSSPGRSPGRPPASPSKIPVFKPSFTAAFAPPVSRPSPKKLASEPAPSSSAAMSKRPRSVEDDGSLGEDDMSVELPNPAKRRAIANKWSTTGSTPTRTIATAPENNTLPKPKPLSPSKKAPYQTSSSIPSARGSSSRRPSGYFARRRSLAVGATPQSNEQQGDGTSSTKDGSRAFEKMKAGLGFRRASVGSSSTNAWKKFDKTSIPLPGAKGGQQKSPGQVDNRSETSTQAVGPSTTPLANTSPTGDSRQNVSLQTQVEQIEGQSEVDLHGPQEMEEAPKHITSVDISSILESEDGDVEDAEDADTEPIEEQAHVDDDKINSATEEPPNGMQEPDPVEEVPSISIEQFLGMTKIRFMDEITAPRRSIHPSQNPMRQAREANEITLAEYFVAMAVDIPQLELFTRVSRDLEAWMEQSRLVFSQAEEEAAKMTPELFAEYTRADEEGKAELLHQLNLIKTNVRAQARSEWYDWKLQWEEGLRETAEKAFNDLQIDAKRLEEMKAKADEIVPVFEREYEEIMRILEQEMAEITDIEASDQDYLNELKATIAEQNIEVEALQAEVNEGNSRLQWLQDKLEESEVQKREAVTVISEAEKVLQMQKNSTSVEVFKLKNELETLEDVHMFHAIRVSPDTFQYIYASQFQVTIPCRGYVPIVTGVEVSKLDDMYRRFKDDFPKLTNFFVHMAKQQIVEGEDLTVQQIVHRLADYWSSCTRLRTQLKLLSIRYPVTIEIVQPSSEEGLPSFKAQVVVMFPSHRAKAVISFIFSTATFCFWPMTLDSLDCDVQVMYGPIDRNLLLKRVADRLSEASPADNHACLLDACIEAQEGYTN
ncbi:hypothetical protein AMATHDRAFT_3619 [Amanita thiersii Skay4041]|uniref:Spc7 kinetochore protein domain-containing protein n=1 Tax=Amanita thiersii Skay4041 TaxID=703135 RepID=A0A2A9NN66_9AGAR|nr:hypothetical protein AMATHDRAFT_3619 [Amanita thiersii Skay4041]